MATEWTQWTRGSLPLVGALANCVLGGLGSFFMLGNLLNRARIPAVSGGMTMATVRLNIMAQFVVRPPFTAVLVAVNRSLLLSCFGFMYCM